VPPTSDREFTGDEGPAGLNRRQMIKAAGIAGAAAWTAPMIIDSLSSPAAAGTVTPGCYRFWLPFNTCTLTATDPVGGACTPSDATCTSTNASVPAGAVTPPACPTNDSQTPVTISVNGGISCRITSVSAYVHHGNTGLGPFSAQCRTATTNGTVGNTTFGFGSGNKSVTVTPTTGGFPFPFDSWQNGGSTPTNSAIGIVLHCP
jgi:hypothetical protein